MHRYLAGGFSPPICKKSSSNGEWPSPIFQGKQFRWLKPPNHHHIVYMDVYMNAWIRESMDACKSMYILKSTHPSTCFFRSPHPSCHSLLEPPGKRWTWRSDEYSNITITCLPICPWKVAKRGKDHLPTIIFEQQTVKFPEGMSFLTINTYLKETNTMSQHRKYTAHHNKIYSWTYRSARLQLDRLQIKLIWMKEWQSQTTVYIANVWGYHAFWHFFNKKKHSMF